MGTRMYGQLNNRVNRDVIENKTVDLDFSEGNQVVSESGKFLGKVTITKDEDFIASNIRKGKTLGEIDGTCSDFGDDNASASEVVSGKKATVNGVDITGTMETQDEYSYTFEGTGTKTFETEGKYCSQDIVVNSTAVSPIGKTISRVIDSKSDDITAGDFIGFNHTKNLRYFNYSNSAVAESFGEDYTLNSLSTFDWHIYFTVVENIYVKCVPYRAYPNGTANIYDTSARSTTVVSSGTNGIVPVRGVKTFEISNISGVHKYLVLFAGRSSTTGSSGIFSCYVTVTESASTTLPTITVPASESDFTQLTTDFTTLTSFQNTIYYYETRPNIIKISDTKLLMALASIRTTNAPITFVTVDISGNTPVVLDTNTFTSSKLSTYYNMSGELCKLTNNKFVYRLNKTSTTYSTYEVEFTTTFIAVDVDNNYNISITEDENTPTYSGQWWTNNTIARLDDTHFICYMPKTTQISFRTYEVSGSSITLVKEFNNGATTTYSYRKYYPTYDCNSLVEFNGKIYLITRVYIRMMSYVTLGGTSGNIYMYEVSCDDSYNPVFNLIHLDAQSFMSVPYYTGYASGGKGLSISVMPDKLIITAGYVSWGTSSTYSNWILDLYPEPTVSKITLGSYLPEYYNSYTPTIIQGVAKQSGTAGDTIQIVVPE